MKLWEKWNPASSILEISSLVWVVHLSRTLLPPHGTQAEIQNSASGTSCPRIYRIYIIHAQFNRRRPSGLGALRGVYSDTTQLNSTELNWPSWTAYSQISRVLFMTSRPTNWVNCCSRYRVELSWVVSLWTGLYGFENVDTARTNGRTFDRF